MCVLVGFFSPSLPVLVNAVSFFVHMFLFYNMVFRWFDTIIITERLKMIYRKTTTNTGIRS